MVGGRRGKSTSAKKNYNLRHTLFLPRVCNLQELGLVQIMKMIIKAIYSYNKELPIILRM